MNYPLPVVISGSIAIDRIMKFSGRYRDHIRTEDLKSLSISILLDELTETHGGVGANIAYSMALLGDSPTLLGAAGPDAARYLDRLAGIGVDRSRVHISLLPTASFNVITDSDQNQVGGFYPGAMRDSASLSFSAWKGQQIIAVVSPHDPAGMRRQVAECHRLGLKLCYDVGQQVSNLAADALIEGLNAAYLLILNEYEMASLAVKTGRSADDIRGSVPIVCYAARQTGIGHRRCFSQDAAACGYRSAPSRCRPDRSRRRLSRWVLVRTCARLGA